jgi:hypothetical protein
MVHAMRSSFSRTLALLAVLAAASSVASASASAHAFVASKTGTLTGGTQFFLIKFANATGECGSNRIGGKITALSSETLTTDVAWSECSFASFTALKLPSAIEYTYNANGTATQDRAISFEVEALGCVVTMTPTEGEEDAATYKNFGSLLEVKRIQKKMKVTTTTSICDGFFEGTASMEETSKLGLEGGTLKWE